MSVESGVFVWEWIGGEDVHEESHGGDTTDVFSNFSGADDAHGFAF